MGFYIVNSELDKQISEIKRSVKLSMNGVVADSMLSKGLKYKKNFGVELPVLRDLAQNYTPNQDLANRLWMLAWRETMIMSLLLEPVDKLSLTKALERVQEAPHVEIIQLLAMLLFSKLDQADELCELLLHQDGSNSKIAAYMLALHIHKSLNQDSIQLIVSNAIADAETTDFRLSNAISKCLARFCRIDEHTRNLILIGTKGFENDANQLKVKMALELKLEMEYIQQFI